MKSIELAGLGYEDRLSAIREEWQDKSAQDVMAEMPEPTVFYGSKDRVIKAVVLGPDDPKEVDDSYTIVRFAEHLQGYSLPQYVGAQVTRQLVAPNSRLIMFQANSYDQHDNHQLFERDRELLKKYGFLSMTYDIAELLSYIDRRRLKLGELGVTGYSLGGNRALHLAATPSDLAIARVNADEVVSDPNRTGLRLTLDFMRSGSFIAQRNAVKRSGLRSMAEVYSAGNLKDDYIKFIKANGTDEAKAITEAMTGDVRNLLRSIAQWRPATPVKLGKIVQSKVFQFGEELLRMHPGAFYSFYEEPRTKHATVNDVFAQAKMAYDGLSPELDNQD